MEREASTDKQRGASLGPRGLKQALAAAYDAYAEKLFRYALMILADYSAAEDAVQQAFAKLTKKGQGIWEVACPDGYLRTAVRNECYRILRERLSRPEVQIESAVMLKPAEEAPIDEQERDAIEEAIRSLPAEQREVVHMKVYEQMTFQEIADTLGVSINTAASRYRYAIGKLRGLLAPYCRTEDHQDD